MERKSTRRVCRTIKETLSRSFPGYWSSTNCCRKTTGSRLLQTAQIQIRLETVSHPISVWRWNKFIPWTYGSKNTYACRLISKFPMDVVSADMPMLLGLDILDREGLIACNVRNELQSVYHGWKIPIERELSHLYVTSNPKHIQFTRPELIKLLRHFRHPSPEKLYAVIKPARPDQADEATRSLLAEVSRTCATCQTYSAPSQTFRVSPPPSDIVFNREIALDVMRMQKRLHCTL